MEKTVKKAIQKIGLKVPEDYSLDHEEIEWIEHIVERAANRGSGLEDAECAIWHQRGHEERISGAKLAIATVRELSGKYFSEGKDAQATALRGLADVLTGTLIPEMEKERDKHKELFLDSYHRQVAERRAARNS
jgi:hypothetical protein